MLKTFSENASPIRPAELISNQLAIKPRATDDLQVMSCNKFYISQTPMVGPISSKKDVYPSLSSSYSLEHLYINYTGKIVFPMQSLKYGLMGRKMAGKISFLT